MATSLTARNMLFGDGVTDPAQDLRLGISGQMTALGTAGSTGLASRGGVRLTPVGTPLAVTPGSGMAAAVAVGQAFIPAASGDSGGLYELTLDTGGSLTVAASDPSNPRIDLIVAQVNDVGSPSSTATVNIITGTPASVPAVPATPAGALALAQILVPAGSTSVVSGNITDLRQWTVALGAILPVSGPSAYPATGTKGDILIDLSSGRLKWWNGTAWVALRAGAFAAVTNSLTAPVTIPGTGVHTAVQSVTFTCDGNTQVTVTAKWPGILMSTVAANAQLNSILLLDGSQFDGWYFAMPSGIASGIATGGGSFETSFTPAAGTHTVAWQAYTNGTTQSMQFLASATAKVSLRVEAAAP